jgi:HSP90 family molecular chaperone
MVRWVVTNDGMPFRPQDWQRLKKIAEGNPDEKLVGAFGVGFYSLFSVCGEYRTTQKQRNELETRGDELEAKK